MKKERHTLKDGDLVKIIQADKHNSPCLRELIERHSGIYIDMVNTYFSSAPTAQAKREIMDDKDYNIYMAALKYDDTRGTKFSTHLGNEAKWICLNYFNKNKNRREVEYNEDLSSTHISEPLEVERDDLMQRIRQLLSLHPDPRVKKIFRLRYLIGEGNKVMAWERVGKKLGISIQGCINIHNRAVDAIKTQLKEDYVK